MVHKIRKVIVDTGPLVAFFNKNDHYHNWTVEQFSRLQPPLFTCESVLSEACFLLRHYENGAMNVLNLVMRGVLKIPFSLEEEVTTISEMIKKYQDIQMSLADACLVRMSEQFSDCVILTFDSDFRKYRKNKRYVIPTIMPEIG